LPDEQTPALQTGAWQLGTGAAQTLAGAAGQTPA
jgi:hypothetical protein